MIKAGKLHMFPLTQEMLTYTIAKVIEIVGKKGQSS